MERQSKRNKIQLKIFPFFSVYETQKKTWSKIGIDKKRKLGDKAKKAKTKNKVMR